MTDALVESLLAAESVAAAVELARRSGVRPKALSRQLADYAFLQTKIDFKVSRKNGKTDSEFSLAKKASSDRLVGKVVDAVRNVTVR